MAKTPSDIATKVREIYDRARTSDTPVSVLSLHNTLLLGKGDWGPEDVEKVGREVIALLTNNEWKKAAGK